MQQGRGPEEDTVSMLARLPTPIVSRGIGMPVSRTRTLSSKYAGAITIRYHGRPPSRIGWIYA